MNLLLWILFGGFAGFIASFLIMRNEPDRTLMNMMLGIFGAIVGGFFMNFFSSLGVTGFSVYSLWFASIGAATLIWMGKKFA